MSGPGQEFVELFLQEASEHLQFLREYAGVLLDPYPLPEDIERLYIAAHGLAGTAGTYGYKSFSEVTGKLAHIFQYAMNSTIGPDACSPLVEFIYEAIAVLESDLLMISANQVEAEDDVKAFKQRYPFAFQPSAEEPEEQAVLTRPQPPAERHPPIAPPSDTGAAEPPPVLAQSPSPDTATLSVEAPSVVSVEESPALSVEAPPAVEATPEIVAENVLAKPVEASDESAGEQLAEPGPVPASEEEPRPLEPVAAGEFGQSGARSGCGERADARRSPAGCRDRSGRNRADSAKRNRSSLRADGGNRARAKRIRAGLQR